jgi:branched-chain amino acid transport system substrate-binding protein
MTMIGYGRSDAANGKVFPYVFPLITSYWNQAAAMIKYLGDKTAAWISSKGKKIVHLYHDSAFGKEPMPVLEALAKQYGFELIKIPVTPPGTSSNRNGCRSARPILTRDPVGLGRDECGRHQDGAAQRLPARENARRMVGRFGRRYRAYGRCGQGLQRHDLQHARQLPGDGRHPQEALRRRQRQSGRRIRIGSVYHMRGVSAAILWWKRCAAQEKFGKGKRSRRADALGPGKPERRRSPPKAIGALGMLPS